MFNAHFSGALVGLTWGLIWIVFIVVWSILRSRERMRLYDLMEKSVQAGQPLLPELTQRLARRGGGPQRDLRAGLIFLAVGLGLAASGMIRHYSYAGPTPAPFHGPFAVFPIFILVGVAFLIMAWLRRNETP